MKGLVLFFVLVAGCGELPAAQREMRGVWLTTVNNTDWPSRPGLGVAEQQEEMRAFLDCFTGMNLNAVMFHVRPSADALYDSRIEPWSDYLSGELGKAPDPFYDPLAFAVEEAHRRGLELHAWLNPYRARHPLTIPITSPDHIARVHPEFVKTYGRFYWLDPGEPEVRRYVVGVVRDIVQRYDIDAIHFDDYFYPYPENDAEFPDEESYRKYGAGLTRNAWRRRNVDLFIKEVSAAIREEKPWVRFGISPFGIWRPGHPASVRGLDAYDRIFADSKRWLQSGWIDYFVPQLYWGRSAPQQRFDHLLTWWSRQNRRRRHLWPGLAAHRVNSGRPNAFVPEEIDEQILRARAERGVSGYVLFTAGSLMRNRGGLADRLAVLNRDEALVPEASWLRDAAPAAPSMTLERRGGVMRVSMRAEGARKWVVQYRIGRRWFTHVVADASRDVPGAAEEVRVAAVGRSGKLSRWRTIRVPPGTY